MNRIFGQKDKFFRSAKERLPDNSAYNCLAMTNEDLLVYLQAMEMYIREEERRYIASLRKNVEHRELREIKQTIKSLRFVADCVKKQMDAQGCGR